MTGPEIRGRHDDALTPPPSPHAPGRRDKAEPDSFSTYAYDTMMLAAEVMRQFGTDRAAIHDGLGKVKDVPSVLFGKATFDPKTRRVSGAKNVDLVVQGGKFTLWDGAKPVLTR